MLLKARGLVWERYPGGAPPIAVRERLQLSPTTPNVNRVLT